MSVQDGRHKAKILEHSIRCAGTGTEYVQVLVDIDGETWPIQIYLTEKSRKMARAQLKQCGFRIDTELLQVLDDSPTHLAGREIDVEVYEDDYRGRTQRKVRILTGGAVEKSRIEEIQEGLRAAGSKTQEEEEIPF